MLAIFNTWYFTTNNTMCAPHGRAGIAKEERCAFAGKAPPAAVHRDGFVFPILLQLDIERLEGFHHVADVLAVLQCVCVYDEASRVQTTPIAPGC